MKHITDLFSARVLEQSQKRAITYLRRGEREEVSFTFQELESLAKSLAANLLFEIHKGPDSPEVNRAILLFPFGSSFLEALLACFYAGIVAIPVPLPRPGESLRRLQKIIEVSQAGWLICDQNTEKIFEEPIDDLGLSESIQLLSIETLRSRAIPIPQFPQMEADAPLLIQFTSGSTADPKGIVLTSVSLIKNALLVEEGMCVTQDSVFINWMPHYHDMGLLGNLIYPLIMGCESVQMAPYAFIQKPIRWLKALEKYRGTISGGPLFAFDLCTSTVRDEDLLNLDLSSWKAAFCGAEPVFKNVLDRFKKRFIAAKLDPKSVFACYGLAEASLYVAGILPKNGDTTDAKWVAKKGSDREPCYLNREMKDAIRIVDPIRKNLVAGEEVEGEVWFSHGSNGVGYYANGAMDPEPFRAKVIPDDGRLYLRTGDIGSIKADTLFITGRLKDLLIINGMNIVAPDIEWYAAKYDPSLNPLAASAFQIEEIHRTVLLIETKKRFVTAEKSSPEYKSLLNNYLFQELGFVLSEIRVLPRGTLPKTTSGKVQRTLIKELYQNGRYP